MKISCMNLFIAEYLYFECITFHWHFQGCGVLTVNVDEYLRFENISSMAVLTGSARPA